MKNIMIVAAFVVAAVFVAGEYGDWKKQQRDKAFVDCMSKRIDMMISAGLDPMTADHRPWRATLGSCD